MAFLYALRRSIPGLVVIAGSTSAAVVLANSHSTARTAHAEAAAPVPPPALDANNFIGFKLVDRKPVTHNTDWYRFALPDAEQPLGLPVASCLLVRAPIGSDKEDGSGKKSVIRPYTPCSEPDAVGHFDLVVKEYPTGVMSKHIAGLQVGDTLECKGPIPKLPLKQIQSKKAVGMIAGGSGLTPMLQVAYAMVKDPSVKTDVTLIFANTSVGDIILKDTLDEMAAKHSNFHVHHVVEKKENDSFKGSVGRVNEKILREHLPPPGDDSLVLVCGPPGMMEAVSGDKAKDKSQGELKGLLKSLGYTPEQVFKF